MRAESPQAKIIGLAMSLVLLFGGMMSCGVMAAVKKGVDKAEDTVIGAVRNKLEKFIRNKVTLLVLDGLAPAGKVKLAIRIFDLIMLAGKIPGTGGKGGLANSLVLGAPAAKNAKDQDYSCKEVPPTLLAAQLYAESKYDPTVTSPAKAMGISQFIQGTWDAKAVDGNGDGKRDIWDIEDAIPSAAKYDCELAKSVRGVPGDPIRNMLAAYNAGPYAVIHHKGVPPFRETNNYVNSIMPLYESFGEIEADAGAGGGASTPLGEQIVLYARKEVNAGYPYIWGGDGPDANERGYDCSGLVIYAVKQARQKLGLPAITLPRTSQAQWSAADNSHFRKVDYSDLRAGDIIYLWSTRVGTSGGPDHVVIYAGNNEILEASSPKNGLRKMPLNSIHDNYWTNKIAVKRVS
ncbi:MAG: transglycosylase SLT domain-containing protein [Streptomycetaceae bacterium]|nr:transglycosylase SLT domain-containing protein [Streptomycetaceae bacterium]